MNRGGATPPAIHGYEFLVLLGSGRFGAVWKAVREDATFVALKVLEPRGPVDKAIADRSFRREALAALNLDHPGIVRAVDAGKASDGRPYIAFEFHEGRTLAREIRDRGAIPEAEVVAMGRTLAAALDHAHRRGLVHRDISAANVLCTPSGARLLDFGLVGEVASGEAPGWATAGFTDPAVLAGGPAGTGADLYALGQTLAAAALGRTAFSSASIDEYRREAESRDLRLPESAQGSPLTPGFRTILERLVCRDPARRYRSAAELLLDLDALHAGDRPLGAMLAGGDAARRSARWIPAVGVVVLAAAAGAVALWDRPAPAPGPSVPVAPIRTEFPSPAAPDASAVKIETLRVLLEAEAPDFRSAKSLEAEIAGMSPAQGWKARFEVLREDLGKRLAAAADAMLREKVRAAEEAWGREGAWPRWVGILSEWPPPFDATPQAAEARARVLERSQDLAARYGWTEDGWKEPPVPPTDPAVAPLAECSRLASWLAAEIERRERMAADTGVPPETRGLAAGSRERLVELRRTVEARIREDSARKRWKALFDSAIESPSDEGFEERCAAVSADAQGTEVGRLLEDLCASAARADAALGRALNAIVGKPWAAVVGGSLRVEVLRKTVVPSHVFAPAVVREGADVHTVTADLLGIVRARPDAVCWLFVNGWPGTAKRLAGDQGPVPALLAAAGAGEAGDPAARAASGDGPLSSAWSRVIAGAAPGGRRPPAGRARSAVGAARRAAADRYLDDDLLGAWEMLAEARSADPLDAEVLVLRARVLDTLSRPLPTAGVAILALAEAREAWDLDPTLLAGPSLFADLALDFRARYPGRLADDLVPATQAACEEVAKSGRESARVVLFLAERRLAAGDRDGAKALVRKVKSQQGDSLPSWAEDLLR